MNLPVNGVWMKFAKKVFSTFWNETVHILTRKGNKINIIIIIIVVVIIIISIIIIVISNLDVIWKLLLYY